MESDPVILSLTVKVSNLMKSIEQLALNNRSLKKQISFEQILFVTC